MEFYVNLRGLTVDKLVGKLRDFIEWGSAQEVHLFVRDKHLGMVDRINHGSELLIAFLDCFESKDVFLLAEVVDLVNHGDYFKVSSNASQCSVIVDNVESNGTESGVDNVDSCAVYVSNDRFVHSEAEATVDWSSIEIAPIANGDIDVPITEENMCTILGIQEEDVQIQKVTELRAPIAVCDIDEELLDEAAIPVDDHIPEASNIAYDRDHPSMYKGAMFPTMKDFRMAVRQFAINAEFDLATSKAEKKRWMGKCKADGCPWRITARLMPDEITTRVLS